jgi:hypothetical protein
VTDFYGQVIEVEKDEGGTFRVRVTGDRSRGLSKALRKLGFAPIFGDTNNFGDAALIDDLDPNDPGEDYLTFSPDIDPDNLQDVLDSLVYRQDGSIVQEIV